MGVRPEGMVAEPALAVPPRDGAFAARIDMVEPMGAETYLHLNACGSRFIARVQDAFSATMGESVTVRFEMSKAHFFDSQGQAVER